MQHIRWTCLSAARTLQAMGAVAPQLDQRRHQEPPRTQRWVKVLDQTRCIGCHACTTACKSENDVPLGVSRTYVKSVDVGVFPQVRRAFQVTRCNQCEDAPCVAACPTRAMYRRPDGIVDFDKRICIGCKACMAACPYDAIFINPDDHSAEKCNFCAHRLEVGLEPACVVVCPTQAILVGDLRDPASAVAGIVQRQAVAVRRPEKRTRPGLYYKGAHQCTLDPLAAERPDGGSFAWAQMPSGADVVNAGQPRGHGPHGSSAAAVVSYDVAHHLPWGWRVSLYTWTKGIAAGAYLAPVLLAVLGYLPWSSVLLRSVGPAIALGFLVLTGLVLIWDLEQPRRFHLIFTQHQWRSWLVRGALVLGAFGAVLATQLLVSVAGSMLAEKVLAGVGIPVALMSAAYTAYLFAQARGRDLWQSPVLGPHLVVEALLAGAGILVPAAAVLEPSALHPLEVMVAAAAAAHLLLRVAETTPHHPTAHARLAAREMLGGRYAGFFWGGAAALAVGLLAPVAGWWAALVALAGLLPHEHAYVQAAQAVPLA
jgi:Fe-S-cluster-containing dehydrogenase component/formate-dependent nitrite reductase membrane component NrfD